MPPILTRLLLLLTLIALTACVPNQPAAQRAKNFPVVVPYAIDRAGETVTVEFELPNAIDPYLEDAVLRPVFIGVRQINKKGTLMTEAERQRWSLQYDYLNGADIPTRIRLLHYDSGRWQPVVLSQSRSDIRADKHWHEPLPLEAIVNGLVGADMDNDEMMAIGKFDMEAVYNEYEFVQIRPPSPGRYRLEVTNLQEHPVLRGIPNELLVSHYYQRGIRQ
jgi:hypothetical protein